MNKEKQEEEEFVDAGVIALPRVVCSSIVGVVTSRYWIAQQSTNDF